MSNIKIAPSILSADFVQLAEEIKKIEAGGADMVHVDVMDGHFVPNITIGIPVVKSLRKCTSLLLDVHLMIENPEDYTDGFADAGADIITFHIEAAVHAHRLVEKIKSRGIRAGVALNPATHHNAIEYILNEVDMVLIMTVNPGFGGQKFIESMIPKIAAVSGRGADIQVDGGIGADNISKVIAAGANIIVAGSSVFGSGDPAKAIRELREAAQK
jgi:ribulose-phosphate 3-epimerase